jgi:hypothetical protein
MFVEEDFYPGAPTEGTRVECEQRVNHFLHRIISLLHREAPKEALLAQANELEASFHHEDSEERVKVGDDIGAALRNFGIEQTGPQNGSNPNDELLISTSARRTMCRTPGEYRITIMSTSDFTPCTWPSHIRN